MNEKLTSEEYWENFWNNIKLPTVAKPSFDLYNTLLSTLPLNDKPATLLEIGCAPGGWLAFFAKIFAYNVMGLEYAKKAASLTRKNLSMQNINAEVIDKDFFNINSIEVQSDIVFSSGFIEHFTDTQNVVNKIYQITNKFVITIVPNVYGINGLISKVCRRSVYENHVPIDLHIIRSLHETAGFKTNVCQYIAGPKLILLLDKNSFSKKFKKISKLINMPGILFNRFVEIGNRYLGFSLRNKVFCSELIYIGTKCKEN